jgi:17beta-estradiol 17-dehydrogenase / very-long-chain 3-oxoacyl-CoA reductase
VLGEFLGELDVDVLVNSAGACYPYARKVVDEELVRNLIRLNVDTVTRVTHVVLPGMVRRGRGAVVNIGSAFAILPSRCHQDVGWQPAGFLSDGRTRWT